MKEIKYEDKEIKINIYELFQYIIGKNKAGCLNQLKKYPSCHSFVALFIPYFLNLMYLLLKYI